MTSSFDPMRHIKSRKWTEQEYKDALMKLDKLMGKKKDKRFTHEAWNRAGRKDEQA